MAELIQIEPDKDLEFKRPFSTIIKQVFSVKNVAIESAIAFKVKTTAPKQYCVRPNSGRLAPGESIQVQILLQAMKEDPPLDFKCKDKFLIQAIKISKDVADLDQDAATSKLTDLWNQVESMKKEMNQGIVCEKKIRVVFLPPDASSVSPQQQQEENLDVNLLLKAKEQQLQENNEKINSLSSACEQYKLEIQRLNQGLKQRKNTADVASTASATKQKNTQSLVPSLLGCSSVLSLEWVVILVILAFMMGYMLS